MKLTPSQAQSLIPLIQQNPGASVTINADKSGTRTAIVKIADQRYHIGGRGSVTTA